MKRNSVVAVLSLMLVFACIFSFTSCEPEPDIRFKSGTFTGRVELPPTASYSPSDVLIFIEELPQYRSRVSSDGSFVLTGLEEGKPYTLLFTTKEQGVSRASAEEDETVGGYAQRIEGATAISGDGTGLGLVALKKMGVIRGQVQLSGQADHIGIDVYVPGTSYAAKTDENGYFKISYVPQGKYRLRLEKSGWQGVYRENLIVEESDNETVPVTQLDGIVVLRKSYGTATGLVYLAGYTNDLSGTIVRFEHATNPEGVYNATTGVDGSFSISQLLPGDYELTFTRNGFKTQVKNETIVASKTTVMDSITLVSSGGIIQGSVKATGAISQEGMQILAVHTNGMPRYSTMTDGEGKFIFENCSTGSYTITASRADYTSEIVESVVVVAGKTIQTVINPLQSIFGSAKGTVSLQGLTSHEGILVALHPTGNTASYSAVTSSDGSFSLFEVREGTYTLEVSKIGYQTLKIADVKVVAGDTLPIGTLELLPSSGVVSGLVKLAGESSYEGTSVSIINTADTKVRYNTISLSDGEYLLTGVKAGEYRVQFEKEGYVSDTSRMINVVLGSTTNMEDVILQTSTANVRGSIKLEGAASNEAVSILLQSGSELSYSTSTSQDGSFVLNRVRPGTYLFSASKSGFANKTIAEVVVIAGRDTSLESVTLPVAVRSVSGQATLEMREDHSGTLVTATNTVDTSLIYSAITNSSGMYTLAGMVHGEYSIVLSRDGYRTVTLPTVKVDSDQSVSVASKELAVAKGSITGLVKLDNRIDMSGTIVELVGTSYQTTTNSQGVYEFLVPAANYPGGVRFSRTDFETASDTATITVLTDSTYAVPEKTIKATHASMQGSVDMMGTDDESGITIALDGTDFQIDTASDGTFRFDHIPIGTYTLSFTYKNTPRVTAIVDIGSKEVLSLGTITLRPNQSSIGGYVSLKGVSNYTGITVTAANITSTETYTTKTAADGSFFIGGLLSTGTYTVTFSKLGWESKSLMVTGLQPLEERDITLDSPIELIDITPPSDVMVSINDGSNTTNSADVVLHISATEFGSGLRKMRISWDGTFDTEAWILFNPVLETSVVNPSNGEKTVYVMVEDVAGNQSSFAGTDTIKLTDQMQTLSGILEAGELHWTKADSPVLVSGDIIVNVGDTLVIDPGVDVHFDGPFAISVRGTLQAIGTEAEPIVFKPAPSYSGRWNGIDGGSSPLQVDESKYAYTLKQGNIIQYAKIYDTEKGIRGKILLRNSTIETNGYALGEYGEKFSGYAVENVIKGGFNLYDSTVFGNTFSGIGISSENQINESRFFNNIVSSYKNIWVGYLRKFEFNTFNSIGKISSGWDYSNTPMGNEFTNIESTLVIENGGSVFTNMLFSNIYDNLGNPEIEVRTPWSTLSSHNWQYNYWGEAHTQELLALKNAGKNNASFIKDAYDNPDVSSLDYRNFVTEPWNFAGYRGDAFLDFNTTFRSKAIYGQNEATIGNPIEIQLEMLTDSNVSRYRFGQNLSQLRNGSWVPYSGIISIDCVDESLLRDGFVDLLMQVEDDHGNVSAIKMLSIGYEVPKFDEISIAEGAKYTNDNIVSVKAKATDNVFIHKMSIQLDDESIGYWEGWYGPSNDFSSSFDPSKLKNGNHTLSFEVQDTAGNTTRTTRNILIDRPIPIASNLSLGENAVIPEGESLSFSFDVKNASHLMTLRVLANGNEMKKTSYADKGSASFTYDTTIPSVYIPNGTSTLSVELTDWAGNVVEYSLGSFTVSGEGIPPVISDVSLVQGAMFTDLFDHELTFTVQDSGGVRLVRVLVNGEEFRILPAYTYSDVLKTRSLKVPLNLLYRLNGTYNLVIEATDFAGYTSTEERTFTINRPLPTPSFTMSRTSVADDANLSFEISVNHAETLAYVQLLVDGHQLQYWGYYGLERSRNSESTSYAIDGEDFPVGVHTITVRAVDIAGNIKESVGQTLTVVRNVNSSDYGLGITWDNDGTLLPDWATHYLWDFDTPSARGVEKANGLISAEIRQTRSGLGGSAARPYINTSIETQFPDSSWTVEYWAKMENGSSGSNVQLQLSQVNNTTIYKQSNDTSSYGDSYYTYYNPASTEMSSSYIYMYASRTFRNEWHHYAYVSTGNDLYLYIDGLLVGKLEDKRSSTKSSNIYVYCNEDNFMDEIRISMRARTVDELWLYVQYAKQFLPE